VGLIGDLLADLPSGDVVEVRIGLRWTAVVAEVEGERRCGLSSTLGELYEHSGKSHVPQAGQLEMFPGRELAAFAYERDSPVLASIGVAALNALLPSPEPKTWCEGNAEHILAEHGARKRVVVVGHFPFISRLSEHVAELIVVERRPREGEFPAEIASQVLPQAEVVAITGMALVNHTLEDLLKLCSPQATVMVLGPSTPFSHVLFNYGVDLLSGSVVTEIEPVLKTLTQGANFPQIHRAGVRLVTLSRSGFKIKM